MLVEVGAGEIIDVLEVNEATAILCGAAPPTPAQCRLTMRVLYWFVDVKWREVRVFCSACRRQKGKCRCADRGYKYEDLLEGWNYYHCEPCNLLRHPDRWLIERTSLVSFNPEHVRDVPKGLRPPIIRFLNGLAL